MHISPRSNFQPQTQPARLINVSSLSLSQEEMKKIVGAELYETRENYTLLSPDPRQVYLTSVPLNNEDAGYYLQSLPGTPYPRDTHLISPKDKTPLKNLSEKILDNQPLQRSIAQRLAPYPSMTCFIGTHSEEKLAEVLGAKLVASNSEQQQLYGTKEGSRATFVQCGVPHPDGTPLVHSTEALVEQVDQLMERNPQARKMVAKLNEGFSGEGNAMVKLPRFQGHESSEERKSLIEDSLKAMRCQAPGLDFAGFSQSFANMGVLGELFVEGEKKTSPSVQVKILEDGQVQVASTHEQILGGPDGQVYIGAQFPAHEAYREDLTRFGQSVGQHLSDNGCRGRFAVDFIAVEKPEGDHDLQAIEINLRKGGTTHPWETMQHLTLGQTNSQGVFESAQGRQLCYRASDNEKQPNYQGLLPGDLQDIASKHKLHFNPETEEGATFHLQTALAEFGKFGTTCIAETPEKAEVIYERLQQAMAVSTPVGDSVPTPSLQRPPADQVQTRSPFQPSLLKDQASELGGNLWLRRGIILEDGSSLTSAQSLDQHLIELKRPQGGTQVLEGHQSPIRALKQNSGFLASGDAGGQVKVWSPEGKLHSQMDLGDSLVTSLALGQGQQVFAGDEQGRIHTQAGNRQAHNAWVNHLEVANNTLISSSLDGTVKAVDIAEGKPLLELDLSREGKKHTATAIALSPQGDRALIASSDRQVGMWDLKEGKCLWQQQQDWRVEHANFSPDGQHIATVSNDQRLRLMDSQGLQIHQSEADHALSAPRWSRQGGQTQLSCLTADGKLLEKTLAL